MFVFVQDMFSGGVEMASTTLEWEMSGFLRHPHAMKSFPEEIARVVGKYYKVDESNVASMKYLHCGERDIMIIPSSGASDSSQICRGSDSRRIFHT